VAVDATSHRTPTVGTAGGRRAFSMPAIGSAPYTCVVSCFLISYMAHSWLPAD